MEISVFDLFSIGIGPSSSHTVGPMRAAYAFAAAIAKDDFATIQRVETHLFGSLAYTGAGHGTTKALLLGLLGEHPETVDTDTIATLINTINESGTLLLLGQQPLTYNVSTDIIHHHDKMLEYHSNGMQFKAFNTHNVLVHAETYYSTGGGFIISETELQQHTYENTVSVQYPFSTAAELLNHCQQQGLSIADIMRANESSWRTPDAIEVELLQIADVMEECINKGCNTPGILEGGLNVNRRAPALHQMLLKQGPPRAEHQQTMNWLNCYAMAVNEENAAGSRVVTAPTNGAAGIIPAVLNYFKYFCKEPNQRKVADFLLTAGAIGLLYKKNASISGAEMGCQGEVGVACSMAAAGLVAAMGGSMAQVENAAEIGIEHNLGLTCDPVKGLVQIPCIERNAMGAVKAVNAAKLALAESGEHKVSLDMAINTMREIGHNMNSIYKETSLGGLAVNVPEC